ncbi:MAG: hypothetical protein PHU77_00625 [Simplicispira sp.]|nr:hypothetical protein [Simplicispira sp.]
MTNSASSEKKYPVQLQANTNGAWKTVLEFDAGNDTAAQQVQQAVVMLYAASTSPLTSWRIATCNRSPDVLSHLSQSTYGVWISRKAERPATTHSVKGPHGKS